MAVPTANQYARLKAAIISKAVRFLVLPEAPFGAFGETAEFGGQTVVVKPDYAIKEMLYGLGFQAFDLPAWAASSTDDTTITNEEVIRIGMNIALADFPTNKLPDVKRCILAATDWVDSYLGGNLGLGE